MTRVISRPLLAVLVLASAGSGLAATVELMATSQFRVKDGQVYRSREAPPTFLVSPSVFGRPVLISVAPTNARLLDPARVTPDGSDPDLMRVDTSGPQKDFLTLHVEGSDLVVERDGVSMTLAASPPLLGDRTLDEVTQALPEYRRNAARYKPDTGALEKLRAMKQPAELIVFFGSWCPHCEQLVPRLVRVLQDCKGAPIAVTFHGVPPNGGKDTVADAERITALPTAIVRRDGKEVARMESEDWDTPEITLVKVVARSPH